MHDDMKFDEFLRGAAKDYKSSTPVDADAIWRSIEPEVAKAINPRRTAFTLTSLRAPTWIGIGIAATLMLGIGIGRLTSRTTQQQFAQSSTTPSTPLAEDSVSRAQHTRNTALQHLAEAEVFLTGVRADMKAGRSDRERADASRELLIRTRLLLNSPNAASPEVHRLLEDLELLLAEIAALPRSRSTMDQKLLDESMRDGNIIPRIRATLPAQAGT